MERLFTTQSIVIATGSSPAHPADVEFDGAIVLDSDQILDLDRIPDTLLVYAVGDVIGFPSLASVSAERGE